MPPRNPHQKPPQRILSIAFTHLQTDRIARMKWGKSWLLDKHPDAAAIVVTDMIKNAIRVVGLDDCAKTKGIHFEQSLSDARALVPDLDCHTAQYDQTRKLLFALASWCERYTPLVAISNAHHVKGDYGLFMDISGCAHLFGGEQAMVVEIKNRLLTQGFQVRLALADTPGAAWAMARYGNEQIIKNDKHPEIIADLPLASLRIPQQTVTALSRVGLKTIGCIANLPRASLATRFGRDLLQKLDQAIGREDEIISPIMPVAELVSEKRFADPIVYEDDVRQVIYALAQNIIGPLEKRDLGVRSCRIKLFRVDGNVSMLEVEATQAIRDATQIARLFKEKLAGLHDDLDAGFGFDLIRLEITRSSPFEQTQSKITFDGEATSQSGDEAVNLIDRLSARLGAEQIQQFVLADTHIPERSFGFTSCVRRQKPDGLALVTNVEIITRPLVLFERPERMETLAQVPDGAPIRFRWRKVLYEVACSEGPERIACEWWKDGRGAKTRDYFRVEDKQGYRFWVFRHGLYEREVQNPDWYVHGLFA